MITNNPATAAAVPGSAALGELPRRKEFPDGSAAARAWRLCAWISGLFTLAVGLIMAVGHLQNATLDPLKSPELRELKAQLREHPADEAVKGRIRELDLQLRSRYFRQLARTETGVYCLLLGSAIFAFSVVRRTAVTRSLPMPGAKLDAAAELARAAARSRWAVAATSTVAIAVLLGLYAGFSTRLPADAKQVDKLLGVAAGEGGSGAAVSDAASEAELKQNWPCFRGFQGAGWSTSSNAPAKWNLETGEGLLWKSASPGSGFNSPLIWGDKVFFSGGDAALREVFCLELQSGKTLWRQAITNVPGSPASAPEIPESTGYAAGSMATDGRRLYTLFANGDAAGLSMDGKVLWSKGFGALKNAYGHATSLATWRDKVIVQLDQGEAEDRKSKLYSLDGRTGKVVWQKDRQLGASWASPTVFETGGKGQVVTLSLPMIISYNAADGAELWRAELLSGEITPSPAFAGGKVFVASPSDKLVAIRPDGVGDIVKSHIVWTNEDNVPDVTSPCSNGELVFALTTSGMLTCFDAKDGKKQWEHDFEFECHASPVIAGNHVYFVGQKGVAVIVEAARQFKEVFRGTLTDEFHASPAFAADKMVLRGVTNIWCFGAGAAPKTARQ